MSEQTFYPGQLPADYFDKLNRLDAVAQSFARESTVAAGNLVLTAESKTYQFINPNGADRTVSLPPLGASDQKGFCIFNSGSAGNTLTLKQGAAQIGQPVTNGWSLSVIWDGATWRAI